MLNMLNASIDNNKQYTHSLPITSHPLLLFYDFEFMTQNTKDNNKNTPIPTTAKLISRALLYYYSDNIFPSNAFRFIMVILYFLLGRRFRAVASICRLCSVIACYNLMFRKQFDLASNWNKKILDFLLIP